jgi:beta-lactamase superfamily II metal-dependent hydrolase
MQAYARAVITAYEPEISSQRGQPVLIIPETRMRFNPTLESVNLFIPGLIALVLTLVSALMTAISLSREKERGTLEILLVSPLRPWQIIVGKVLPYLGLAFANVITALLAAWRMPKGIMRVAAMLALAGALALIVTGVEIRHSLPPDRLRLTVFDVGQGDAMLLQTSDQSLLVDTGGSPFGGGGFDIGARVLAPALWARGVRGLDDLLVTHGDPDHIGGALAVLADFRPRDIWWGVPVPLHVPSRTFLDTASR